MHRSVYNHRLTKPRLLAALALATVTFVMVFFVLTNLLGGSVSLLAGPGRDGGGGCYLNFAVGRLLIDPVAGTAIEQTRPGAEEDDVSVTPVMWPTGYTGRRSGSEVEVLDERGQVVARTGSKWRLQGGYESSAQFTSGYWRTCSMIPPMLNWTLPPVAR